MNKFQNFLVNVKDWFVKVGKAIGKGCVLLGHGIKKAAVATKDFTVNTYNSLASKIRESKYKRAERKERKDIAKKAKAEYASLNLDDKPYDSSSRIKTSEEESEKDKEQREANKRTAIIIMLAIIIILLLFHFIFAAVQGGGNSVSKNKAVNLANNYADVEEFDRALDTLDKYLTKHPKNKEVWNLFNEIAAKKKNALIGDGETTFVEGSDTIDINAPGITNAMQDSLNSMQNALALYNRQAEENKRLMDELMALRNSQGNMDELKRQADQALAELEAERKAKDAAAEEQKRLQEEKRRAEEAELAKKDSELKSAIDALNNEIQKGKNALSTGNNDNGINYFNNAVKLIPGSAGKEFSSDKKSEMALALYDSADKALNPDDKTKLMGQAVIMAQDALKDNPDNAVAHYVIAQNAINNKNYNEALKEMTAAVEHSKASDYNRYLYYYELGKLQYRMKKYSEAANSFQTSCDLKNDFTPSRFNLGLTQKQLKNENAALAAFRKTIDIDPRYEKAYLEEARILAARNDYSGAIDAYKSCLKINNVNVQAAMELGSVYYKKKDYVNAEDSYRRALTMLGPGEELTLTKYNLSTVLYDAGKVDEAVKYAKEAYEERDYLRNKTQKANLTYNYALVLDKTGSTSKAIPVYGDVLKINPDHAKAKINLGVIYMSMNPPDKDKALQYFLEVYTKENDNFEANNNLGSVYLMKEDYKNAIKFFQNALKIDPKNNDVRANLAKAYARNGDYENARTVYTDLLKTDINNWDAYVELAKVCMQLNDNVSAEKYLIYVQEKNPSYRMSEVNSLLKAIK